jgi:hypothetical protein
MKAISFSVFGTNRTYSYGMVSNAHLCRKIYPGWTCIVYYGKSVDRDDLKALNGMDHVELRRMRGTEDWSALMWRFCSLADYDDVDVHVFRDADSRVGVRERAAVDEWLSSGKQFHIMRDHPQHWIEMLAGMWGCNRAGAERIKGLLPDPLWNSQPYVDQWWLRDVVYPIAKQSMMVHDSVGHISGEPHRGFPVDGTPGDFIGRKVELCPSATR